MFWVEKVRPLNATNGTKSLTSFFNLALSLIWAYYITEQQIKAVKLKDLNGQTCGGNYED